MAKAHRIRTRRHSGDEILIQGDKVEARAEKPSNHDDPAWLRRRAERMRVFALRRQKARERKLEERRKDARAVARSYMFAVYYKLRAIPRKKPP